MATLPSAPAPNAVWTWVGPAVTDKAVTPSAQHARELDAVTGQVP